MLSYDTAGWKYSVATYRTASQSGKYIITDTRTATILNETGSPRHLTAIDLSEGTFYVVRGPHFAAAFLAVPYAHYDVTLVSNLM